MTATKRAIAYLEALFYLPSYALELNPDEYVIGDLKLRVAN